jgi:hypothetical protein
MDRDPVSSAQAQDLPLSAEERELTQDYALKQRELDIKEREVKIKEAELTRSRWLNPTVIGLFAAALGLIGNVIVAGYNNSNSEKLERERAQSNLILESIKTGNSQSACKNLVFFVQLGLLEDPKGSIRSCVSAPLNSPVLPSNIGANPGTTNPGSNPNKIESTNITPLGGRVSDRSGHAISGAQVHSDDAATAVTDSNGRFLIRVSEPPSGILIWKLVIDAPAYRTE